jgi:midasin (ATPase involved in ribosome maturation)
MSEGLCAAQACIDGTLVIMEDLNEARADVLALLCNVVERGRIDVNARGKFDVHADFRVFATVRTPAPAADASRAVYMNKMCARVLVDPFSNSELLRVRPPFLPIAAHTISRCAVRIYHPMWSDD